jgi:ribosomal protein S18 acetylase RimI-like enzyme
VHHLAVRREHRERGYGERLIREAVALAEAEGIRRLELSVWAFNTAARGFFARQGFAIFNERMCLEWEEGQSW